VSAKESKPSFEPAPGDADTLSMDEQQDVKSAGRVKFDDRGNAVWEWAMATGAFGVDASPSARLRKLEHPALSIADEGPVPTETVRANPLGKKKGYDPYDSGRLGKTAAPPRKKDLRKLSEWLKLKKQHEELKKDRQNDK